jgi:hypothetical protein
MSNPARQLPRRVGHGPEGRSLLGLERDRTLATTNDDMMARGDVAHGSGLGRREINTPKARMESSTKASGRSGSGI